MQWPTKRIAQAGTAAVMLGLASGVFPWSSDPEVPATFNAEFHLGWDATSGTVDISPLEGPGEYRITGIVAAGRRDSEPPGAAVVVDFDPDVTVDGCPECNPADDAYQPRTRHTMWMQWEGRECGSQSDEICYWGSNSVTIHSPRPLILTEGTERAEVRLPSIRLPSGGSIDTLMVNAPLDTAFSVMTGPQPTERITDSRVRWANTPEAFRTVQVVEAARPIYGYREARIFFAGIFASIAASEGIAALYPRRLREKPNAKTAPEPKPEPRRAAPAAKRGRSRR